MNFKKWLIKEAAINTKNIQYNSQGRPSFRIYVLNDGRNVGLELLTNGSYKYAGDMSSELFDNSYLLKVHKIFSWHSDLPEGAGYGPMFYEICMEIATNKGGHLVSATLANRLHFILTGDFDYEFEQSRKGRPGGDTGERAEGVYKKFYERSDIEKKDPKEIMKKSGLGTLDQYLKKDPEYPIKPWMYQLYRKKPNVLSELIRMNGLGDPVFVMGTGNSAKPIKNINLLY